MTIAQPCEYSKNHLIVHFKVVSFMVCEFSFNQSKKKKYPKDCKALCFVDFRFCGKALAFGYYIYSGGNLKLLFEDNPDVT